MPGARPSDERGRGRDGSAWAACWGAVGERSGRRQGPRVADVQVLPAAETVASVLRQMDFLQAGIAALDRLIAQVAVASPQFRRLTAIPGVDAGTAAAVPAAIGDVRWFASARQVVPYLGLDPTSRGWGEEPARGERISKRGNRRCACCSWRRPLPRSGGPLRALRGAGACAATRKLAVLCWHLLSRDEGYAFDRPSLMAEKVRRLQLQAGAPHLPRGRHDGPRVNPAPAQHEAERILQAQADLAYRRLIDDWHASGPREVRARQRGAHLTGHRWQPRAAGSVSPIRCAWARRRPRALPVMVSHQRRRTGRHRASPASPSASTLRLPL